MKKTDNINYVDNLNSYIANAKQSVQMEQAEARKNTLQLIANLAALSVFMIKNKDEFIFDKNFNCSEKKLKAFLKKSVYVDNATRSDYMRISAATYVADKVNRSIEDLNKIQESCNDFVSCYESVNDLFIESGAKKVSSGAGKRKEEQNKTTDTDTDTDTKKPLFEKASESLANIAKLLTKAKKEELTDELFTMLESNITNIQAEIKRCKAKKNFSYKTSQKAA